MPYAIDDSLYLFFYIHMNSIPKLKKSSDRRPVTISLDKEVAELYEIGRRNGHDTSELARQIVQKTFLKLADKLKVKED